MFDILFGWSKASKCKKAIKSTQCRLRLLKNKREAIVRQLRKDLAELIQSGHEETAFNRVEQLIEDESLAAAYESLDRFCEFILTQLSYIRRNKDCPNDINEAVSSLIFASARCGDLPELCAIRKLFRKRYGDKFVTTAIELFPGNLVNKQLKENLSRKFVPDYLKYRMVDEIVRDNCLQEQFLAIQYYPDWQQLQVKDNKGCEVVGNDVQIKDSNAGSKVHPSEIEVIKSDVTCFNSYISKHSTHYYRKRQKPSRSKILESCHSEDESGRKQFNLKMTGCSLNKELEGLSIKPNRGIKGSHIQQGVVLDECSNCQPSWDNDELNQVMELLTIPKRSHRNSYSSVGKYHEFDYPESKVGNGNNEIKEVTFASKGSYASANVSNSRTNVSLPIETEVPYTRAMTMPQGRDRNSKDKILRTYSCPSQHPNHVHPKLPDYDDITAKFTALKREQLQNKKLD
ncbi:hypothetical protein Lal_00002819 [Lupinus albus]|uniref:Putative vacuolar protein sorting-associated protein Ist1 n=1 Tax=Lupinus albus TaxID=3870 RepID=A0A6A5NBW0_LUPAL|nr:putative vacuolar protein sorting-associated protein Ist1 [Lupinus albus]KAF1882639.1 hypothetical protein Lal_00002819 [Lupinus albus]